MRGNRYLILAILGIVGIVAVSGCTSTQNQTTSSNLGPNDVAIKNFAFNPATLTVKAGTTVTWVNQDSTTHRVVSDSGAFDSGNLSNGQSYSETFNQAGSFPYHCSIHPSMKGTIVVTGASSNTTPTTTQTPSPAPSTSGGGTGYSY